MKNSKVQFIVGIVISAIFLYIALRPVQMQDLLVALKTFHWQWAIPYLIVTWFGFYLRAFRWKHLLAPIKPMTANRLFSPLAAGFGLNNLFPARLGEVVRAYILLKKENIPFMSGFGTVVVERLFDMLMLLALLAYALTSTKIPDTFTMSYGDFTVTGAMITSGTDKLGILCGVIFCGVLLMLIPAIRRVFETIVLRLPFVPHKVKDFIVRMIHSFADGLSSLKSFKAWFFVAVYTAATWLVCAWTFQILSYGFDSIHLTFTQALTVMTITCIAIAIPSAPGFWGLFELGVMFGLLVLGAVPETAAGRADALAYAFINHGLVYATMIPVGLYFLYKEKMTLADATNAKQETEATQ